MVQENHSNASIGIKRRLEIGNPEATSIYQGVQRRSGADASRWHGHSATSVAERLGLSGPNLLYRWKRELIGQAGRTAETLDGRVRELEAELRRVQQERDILRKSLAIFGREE